MSIFLPVYEADRLRICWNIHAPLHVLLRSCDFAWSPQRRFSTQEAEDSSGIEQFEGTLKGIKLVSRREILNLTAEVVHPTGS